MTSEELVGAIGAADWVFNVIPFTPETAGFVSAQVLSAMKPGAVFINVGRGKTVDQPALTKALQTGHLRAAALDVFMQEPLSPTDPLWSLPNVLISPHTASHSQGQNEAILEIFLDNLARFRAGRKLRNDVDELGY